jgi:hypothetical protein
MSITSGHLQRRRGKMNVDTASTSYKAGLIANFIHQQYQASNVTGRETFLVSMQGPQGAGLFR